MATKAWLYLLFVGAAALTACGKSGERSSDEAITAGASGKNATDDAGSGGRSKHRAGDAANGAAGSGAEADSDAGANDRDGGVVAVDAGASKSDSCATRVVTASVRARTDADLDALSDVTLLIGSIEISGTVSKLDALKCLSSLDGSLSIRSADSLVHVALPELRNVTGDISVQSSQSVVQIAAPRLQTVGRVDSWSLDFVELPELTVLDMRSLRELPGGLSLSSLSHTADAPLTLSLDALARIGGSLRLESVSRLQDLSAFEHLAQIEGELQLLSSSDLVSAALPTLTKLGQRLNVQNDNALTSIDLRALLSVGETDSFSIYIQHLPELTSFDASALKELPATLYMSTLSESAGEPLSLRLRSLGLVRGSLHLDNVSRLLDLDGLAKLAEVTGDLQVLSSSELNSVALPALTKLGGIVNVQSDTALSLLDLHALATVGAAGGYSLYIYNLPKLTLLDASSLIELPAALLLSTLSQTAGQPLSLELGALALIHGTMQLHNLSHLTSLDGFAKLTEISNELELTSNAELVSASLPALKKLGGRVNIQSDDVLEAIDLHALTKVGIVDSYSLYVKDLPKLRALDASSLRELPAAIYLHSLGSSANAPLSLALDSLVIVRGGVELSSLARLEHVDSFAKVTRIAKDLDILSNPHLTSLSGLNALQILDGSLRISNNPMLSTCAAKALATRLKPDGSSGTIAIDKNADDGC